MNFHKKYYPAISSVALRIQHGFTLIELLVVIAIIGLLASIVLSSLAATRLRGKDTKIISDVEQARAALETGFYLNFYQDLSLTATALATNVVDTPLLGAPDYTPLTATVTDAAAQGGSIVFYVNGNASRQPNAYAIYGQLASSASSYFCLDSGQHAKNYTSAPTFAAACP